MLRLTEDETAVGLLWSQLWEKVLLSAIEGGPSVPAEAVQGLIDNSRIFLAGHGAVGRSVQDGCLLLILSEIMCCFPEPNARIFQHTLDIELEPYFAERLGNDATQLS